MHCPITGINIPRFLVSVIAGFVFIFGFDFIIHGQVLADLYAETADLWRPPEEMETYFPFMMGSQLLLALITAFIFTRNFEEKGIGEGIRFGLLLGTLLALLSATTYVWMPIPLLLAVYWAAAGLMQGLGLGIIFGLLYKK